MMSGKVLERLEVAQSITLCTYLQGVKKTTRNLCQHIWYYGRHSNRESARIPVHSTTDKTACSIQQEDCKEVAALVTKLMTFCNALNNFKDLSLSIHSLFHF
jgi:hypothetical protein